MTTLPAITPTSTVRDAIAAIDHHGRGISATVRRVASETSRAGRRRVLPAVEEGMSSNSEGPDPEQVYSLGCFINMLLFLLGMPIAAAIGIGNPDAGSTILGMVLISIVFITAGIAAYSSYGSY